MLDQSESQTGSVRALRSAPLPVAELVVGKEAEEAAALLPRLFNLCRMAQSMGARAAFGLPIARDQAEAVRIEVLREHLIKMCLKLPGHFGQASAGLPQGWDTGAAAAREAHFGPRGKVPATPGEFDSFLATGSGLGHTLAKIRDCFKPGEACSAILPAITAENALSAMALENSVAGRHAAHPLMRDIEGFLGRGPLWRATARALDIEAAMDDALPALVLPEPGVSISVAARGTYAISATVEHGVVTAFRRITPTDHLLAKGGILDQTLASLPAHKSGMAPLLLDILDPCSPVRLEEVRHA